MVIDVSKSKRLSASPVTELILTPNFFAYPAALNILSPPSLPKSANASVESAKSAINCDGMIPFCFANCCVVLTISKATPSEFPFNLANEPANEAASVPLIPIFVDMSDVDA